MKKSNLNAKLKKNPKAKSNYFTGKVTAGDISSIVKPKEEKIYHVIFLFTFVKIILYIFHVTQ